jgi:hypothetical protein
MALKLGVTDHPPYSPNLTHSDFHLFETFKQNLGHQKFPTDTDLSPLGYRHLTLIYSMPGYKPWCHDRANAFTSKVTTWSSDVYHLLSMYHVHIDVRALHSVMMCLHHCFLNTNDSSRYHRGCVMTVRSFLDKIPDIRVINVYLQVSITNTNIYEMYVLCSF